MKIQAIVLLLISTVALVSCGGGDDSGTRNTNPSISTIDITEITANSALVRGELINLGSFTIQDHGFVIGTNEAPDINDTKVSLGSISQVQVFETAIGNLIQNTNYYVRSFIQYDSSELVYGNSLSFSTLMGPWEEKAPLFDKYLAGAVSFEINDLLYVGTGLHNTFSKEFFKYDEVQNEWSEVAEFPGQRRSNAVSFELNGYGFVGLGYDCVGQGQCTFNYLADFWRYNPTANSWSEIAVFPGDERVYATSFVIDGIAYVTGRGDSGIQDLWAYNPNTNSWQQKANYPGGCTSRQSAFVVDGKAIVGLGFQDGTCKDLWEYNPISDSWQQKNDFPGEARYHSLGITLNNTGFITCGMQSSNSDPITFQFNDIWQYNAGLDSWVRLTFSYPGNGRNQMIAEVINGKIIMGLGTNIISSGPAERFGDIWALNPFLE